MMKAELDMGDLSKRQICAFFLLIVCMLAIGVGLLEYITRQLSLFPPDNAGTYAQSEDYLYFHAANSEGHEISPIDEFPPVYLRYNKFGFRGGDFSMAKESGKLRVVVVGDSYVEGRQVAEVQTLSHQLELLLNNAGIKAQVINAGCSAYTTTTEYLLLKHLVAEFQPDIVISLFCFNDYHDNFVYKNYSQYTNVFEEGLPVGLIPETYKEEEWRTILTPRWWIKNSALVSLGNRYLSRLSKKKITYQNYMENRDFFYNNWALVNKVDLDSKERHLLDFTHKGIEEMAKLCASIDARYMFAIIPLPSQVDGEEWGQGRVTVGLKPGEITASTVYQDRLMAFAVEKDILGVDLLPPFKREKERKPLFLPYDGHFAPYGHQLTAEVLFDAMKKSFEEINETAQ